MGTWGAGIFEDDVALDVRDAFRDATDSAMSATEAADQVLQEFSEQLEDSDDGPVIRLALASLLLDCGITDHPALDQAVVLIENGEGLDRWEDAGPEALAERRTVHG